jgi:predicted GH43/DUF377 family glycosyl hydrolase
MTNRQSQLFQRHDKNPILSAADWPYRVHSVFNPGATLLQDGTTLLLCRVENYNGHSHLCAARSANGIDGWKIDPAPTFPADPEHFPEELWGVEDPRVVYLPELKKYAITYTAFSSNGPGVALALTEDFRSFERRGLIMRPDDKDAALLPCRMDGRWVLVHRPASGSGGDMWLSYSSDLQNWGSPRVMMAARSGGWWDANKIGLSSPLLETPQGWLVIYHGVRRTASGAIDRVGLARFVGKNVERCIARGDEWVFGPQEP